MRSDLKAAALFPGQGAQMVGMGKDLADNYEKARDIFEIASNVLGLDLLKICCHGPEEILKKTDISQVAILAVSLACFEVFKAEVVNFKPFIAGGLSLGEYSALVAAGYIDITDAFAVVKKRGEFMQQACDILGGTMASVLGLSNEVLSSICQEISETDYVDLANLNCPEQTVVSGTRAGVEKLEKLALKRGAKKVIVLNVAGGFHSKLMQSAADKLKPILASKKIKYASGVKLVTNVTGKEVTAADNIYDILVNQVVSPVYWEEDIKTMFGVGVDCFIEFGPGKILGGLLKRIERKATYMNIENVDSLKKSIEFINTL